MKLKKNLKKLAKLLSKVEKQFGKGAIVNLEAGEKLQDVEVIPSGSLALDLALGVGGWPRGRVVELFGPESSGKSTLALSAVRECQKLGGTAVYIDAEHALDIQYAKKLGVCVEQLLFSQPDDGEQALRLIEFLLRDSDSVDMIVIDSVAALIPRAELEGEMDEFQIGLQARMMSKALRKLVGLLARRSCTLLFINQVRQKIGFGYGGGEVTPGGNALKFFSSVRVELKKLSAVKSDGTVVGQRVRAKVVKNKLFPPFREAEFEIRYGSGLSAEGELLDLAVKLGIIERSGAWYSYGTRQLGQGREKAAEVIAQDKKLRSEIKEKILKGELKQKAG